MSDAVVLPDLEVVWAWISSALAGAGLPELEDRIVVILERRRQRAIASMTTSGQLRISLRPWALLSDADREDTIRHEVAHLVAFVRHGHAAWNHGPLWKRAARQCGARPTARMKLTPELTRAFNAMRGPVRRVVAVCACTTASEASIAALSRLVTGEYLLKPRAARAAAAGAATCRICRVALRVRGQIVVGERRAS